jgi:hypothetical protein
MEDEFIALQSLDRIIEVKVVPNSYNAWLCRFCPMVTHCFFDISHIQVYERASAEYIDNSLPR